MGLNLKHPARITFGAIAAILFALVLFAPAAAQEGVDTEVLEQGAQIYA